MAKKIVSGGIRILRSNKAFRQALLIREVGATAIRTKRGMVFKLGGGLFSKRQIVASRIRYARTVYGIPKKRLKGFL